MQDERPGRPQTGGIDAWPSERQPAKGAEGPPPIEPPLDGLQAYRERASHLGGSTRDSPTCGLAHHPAKLFSWLVFHRLAKAHTGTAAVFVDELHAGVLEGASNDVEGGAPRLRLIGQKSFLHGPSRQIGRHWQILSREGRGHERRRRPH
jgi:hypothetical protein